jgi:hypothetical protein
VSALDAKIDDLYRLPLAEFTGARNALAKSLTGDEAKRVRKLEKPTVVPWAANQVYWRARSTYDRLMKSGEKLRAAQIAALEGRAADVRAASEAHRRAIADAVAEAERCPPALGSPSRRAGPTFDRCRWRPTRRRRRPPDRCISPQGSRLWRVSPTSK